MLDGSIISSCYNLNISRSIQRSSSQLIQYIKGHFNASCIHVHTAWNNLTANKNVLSIYDKPIAIVYARYNRSSMLVLVHFISKFQHDM